MNLREKVEYEYRCFFLDMMRTSKENIFAHSDEIEVKKRIREALLNLTDKLDESDAESLLVQQNLLEAVYLGWQDAGNSRERFSKDEFVQQWLVAALV